MKSALNLSDVEVIAERELVQVGALGTLVFDSRISTEFPGLDKDELHRIIQDNVVCDPDGEVFDEWIDWPSVLEYVRRMNE